ncbi:hypothetical protein LCGC14_0353460 [marine sediment metagenome]|uniref:Uncharacterized protein n=1 Tax=marine sediment metagenome TaxID=412755 RepID=A0A0F9TFQ2_9ZZZZ
MADTLIAKIESLSSAIKGAKDTKVQIVKLKEANGQSYEWSTFHAATFDGYEVGDVIEIVPALKWRDGQQYPYRNVQSVLGKREVSEINTFDVLAHRPGQTAETSGSTNGTYDQGKAIERRSIERQTSLKLVVELFKAGCGAGDLDDVVAYVIKAAVPLEEHLARQGALAIPQSPSGAQPTAGTNGAASSSPASSSNGKPSSDSYKMETVGDLFTAVKARYNKTPPDIFDALDVKTKEELLVNTTVETAWLTLQSIWEGPSAQEEAEN